MNLTTFCCSLYHDIVANESEGKWFFGLRKNFLMELQLETVMLQKKGGQKEKA